jgi:hypothetical protein
MAWLWKQGRPTLLTLAGLGFLGYTVLHKEREPVGPGQAGAGARRAVTARPPLTASTPEATSTKPAFLGGLGITERLLALSRKSERTIAWAGRRSWPITSCLPSFRLCSF